MKATSPRLAVAVLVAVGVGFWMLAGIARADDKAVTVEVPAKQAWTKTGIKLESGQRIRIEVSGAVQMSVPDDKRVFYHDVPPEGRAELHAAAPQPMMPALALLGRFGEGGPVFFVGKFVDWLAVGPPYGTGELMLGVNDSIPQDNSGAWSARVTILDGATTGNSDPPAGAFGSVRTIKAAYDLGEPISIEFSDPLGDSNNWIALAKVSDPPQTYGPWARTDAKKSGAIKLDGLDAGDYEVRGFFEYAKEGYKVSARQAFTVKDLGAGVMLKTEKPAYGVDEKVVVEFLGFPKNANDWITLIKVPAPDDAYGAFQYTGGKRGGSLEFGPQAEGDYEARAYFNWPDGGYKVQARYAFKVGKGGGGAVGGGGACADPQTLRLMDDWLAKAIPPQQEGESLRYEAWGRVVGKSRSATLTVSGPPTTPLPRCEFLWQHAAELNSTNGLGTLKEYVEKQGK